MGQILVRNLENNVIERQKARALRADKSLEQTVRDILTARPGEPVLDLKPEGPVGRTAGSTPAPLQPKRH